MEWLGWIAAASSGLRSVPQVMRMLRTGHTRGVNVHAMLFTTATAVGWCVWASGRGNLPVLLSSALTAVGFGIISARLIRSASPRSLGLQLAWALGLLIAFAIGGTATLGWLVSFGSTVQFLPQGWSTLHERDLTGISAWTYALALGNELLWTGYAISIASPVLLIPYLVRTPTSGLILVRTLVSRHAGAGSEEPPPPAV